MQYRCGQHRNGAARGGAGAGANSRQRAGANHYHKARQLTAASHRRETISADTARVDVVISATARANTSSVSFPNSPPASPPVVLFPGVVTVVSYEAAHKYGREMGLAEPGRALDLKSLNAHRKALGLFPFALKG